MAAGKVKVPLDQSIGPQRVHFVPPHFRILSQNFPLGDFYQCKRRLLISHQHLMNGMSDVQRP